MSPIVNLSQLLLQQLRHEGWVSLSSQKTLQGDK